MNAIFDINSWIISKLHFSNGLWALVGAILFALLCVFFLLSVRGGRVKAREMLAESGWMALWYFGILALSLLTYSPKGKALWTPGQPLWLWCPAALVILVAFGIYFFRRRKRFIDQVSANAIRRSAAGSGASKYCFALLFAGMLVMTVVGVIRVACGDSILHLVVPMLVTILTLLLFSLTRWKLWFAIGALLQLAYAFVWMQSVLAADGFGYTPLLAMIPLFLSQILAMGSLAFFKK